MEPIREAAVVTSEPMPAIADAPASREQRPHDHRENAHREHKPHGGKQHHGKARHGHQAKRPEKLSQQQHNERARQPEAVDKSELPAFLFRPVPVKKVETKE